MTRSSHPKRTKSMHSSKMSLSVHIIALFVIVKREMQSSVQQLINGKKNKIKWKQCVWEQKNESLSTLWHGWTLEAWCQIKVIKATYCPASSICMNRPEEPRNRSVDRTQNGWQWAWRSWRGWWETLAVPWSWLWNSVAVLRTPERPKCEFCDRRVTFQ